MVEGLLSPSDSGSVCDRLGTTTTHDLSRRVINCPPSSEYHATNRSFHAVALTEATAALFQEFMPVGYCYFVTVLCLHAPS